MLKTFLTAIAILTIFPIVTSASLIEVTGADLSGYRTTDSTDSQVPSSLIATDGWKSNPDGVNGFKIEWDITQNPITGEWTYKYWLTDEDGLDLTQNAVSHWLLQVSPSITEANLDSHIYEKDFDIGQGSPKGTWPSSGNPNLPNDFYAIEILPISSTSHYQFKSDRVPVWGHFYAKDGVTAGIDATAWNLGLDSPHLPDGLTTDFAPWIPVVDTRSTVVPEPGSVAAIAAISVVGLIGYARRRKPWA